MENQPDKSRTVTIAIVSAIVALLLGLCGGAAIGGVAGFALGRSAEARAFRSPNNFNVPQPFRVTPQAPGTQQLPPASAASGVLVLDVVANSPAEQAGIEPGDVITQVNGTQVGGTRPLADFLTQFKPGDRLRLTVGRGGATRMVTVTLGSAPGDSQRAYLGIRYNTAPAVGASTPQP